jgi:acyl carrier protein
MGGPENGKTADFPHGGREGRRISEVCVMSEAVAATPDRIKRLIVESLNLEGIRPEMIEDEAPLFGEGLGLDSVDALELVVALEKEFGIRIKSQEIGREVFSSVSTLSQFIEGRT